MLARMQARGQRIVIRLYMEARMEPSVMSRNVVAEIRGSTYPDEVRNTPISPSSCVLPKTTIFIGFSQVVVISGHIDSWDVGQGAQDDAGGVHQTLVNAANIYQQQKVFHLLAGSFTVETTEPATQEDPPRYHVDVRRIWGRWCQPILREP